MGEDTGERRPSIQVVEVEYTAMVEQVQKVLTAQHGAGTWVQIDEPVTGFACDEVEGGAGLALDLGTGSSIGEEDWPAALGAVRDIVGGQGFTELDTVIDEPGDHLVRLARSDGGYLDFGTREATILTLMTGCHPTDASTATGD